MSEKMLRRRAKKIGLILRKSKRPISINNCGGYQLVVAKNNAVLQGAHFELLLPTVERIIELNETR